MQILALAGIMMVNVIILSKIKIKIDDIMKASKNENTSVKVPSVRQDNFIFHYWSWYLNQNPASLGCCLYK